jgi:hypothetical protein
MNNSALRLFVRSIIAEAKDKKADKEPKKTVKKEAEDKKSSKKDDNKLVNLKKKLAALKKYRDELQVAKFAEKTAETEVEFADLAGFAKELKTLKEKGVALEEKIESRIEELEQEIKDAINTVKEMMGLTSEKKGKEEIVDEARFKKGTELKKAVKKENIHNTAQMGGVTTSKGTAGYINNTSKMDKDYANFVRNKFKGMFAVEKPNGQVVKYLASEKEAQDWVSKKDPDGMMNFNIRKV